MTPRVLPPVDTEPGRPPASLARRIAVRLISAGMVVGFAYVMLAMVGVDPNPYALTALKALVDLVDAIGNHITGATA